MKEVKGIGTDIIEIPRISLACNRTPGFLKKILTANEIETIKDSAAKSQKIAGKFAAKEAVAKAIGQSLSWQDVEIINNKKGKPIVSLYGKAKELVGSGKILVSISHCSSYATASAIFEGK